MRMSCIYLFLLFFIPVQAMDLGSLLWHAPSFLMASYVLLRPKFVKRATQDHPQVTTGLVATGWAAEQGYLFYHHYQGTIDNLQLYGGTAGLAIAAGVTLHDLVCVQRTDLTNIVTQSDVYLQCHTVEPVRLQTSGDCGGA